MNLLVALAALLSVLAGAEKVEMPILMGDENFAKRWKKHMGVVKAKSEDC